VPAQRAGAAQHGEAQRRAGAARARARRAALRNADGEGPSSRALGVEPVAGAGDVGAEPLPFLNMPLTRASMALRKGGARF